MTIRVPIKHLFDVSRQMIMPSDFGNDSLFHYSLPAWHEHGDGIIENAADLASGKLLLRGGEVLVSKLNPEKSAVLLAEPHEIPTVCSPEFIALVPRKIDRKFAYHFMLSAPVRHQLNASVESVTNSHKRARVDRFLASNVDLPDIATQRQIADFLDRETARIDLLIEKKQRLVALLEERKTIQLEKLLFNSGFEIRKLRREAQVISKGTTPSTIGAEMVAEGIRFLKAENVTWSGISTSPENFISSETHRQLKRSALQAGDVLVVIAGATTGKTAVLPSSLTPANTNQAVSFVRLRKPIYGGIICAAIGCPRVQRDILLTSVQSAQPNLSMEDLGNLMLPFPNEYEVSGVLDRVTAIGKTAERVVAATELSIDRLKEYRSALITAAVTGQINVQTYARSGTIDRRFDAIQGEMRA